MSLKRESNVARMVKAVSATRAIYMLPRLLVEIIVHYTTISVWRKIAGTKLAPLAGYNTAARIAASHAALFYASAVPLNGAIVRRFTCLHATLKLLFK